MKSSRLTALFMFATLMAVTALAQGLTFNSQFYGPGYYRVISANGRAMNVIANTQNGITDMSAVQLLSLNPAQTTEADLHPLRSAAGSVLEAQLLQLPDDQMVGRSLNSPQLDLATQGSSTGEITSSGQIGRLAQSFLKIDRVPVSISDIDPETGNKWGAHPFFSGAEQYRAYFSIFGEYIYFKDNNGGFFMGTNGQYNGLLGSADNNCNWLILPFDKDFNYYTPEYNNADRDGYLSDGTRNWATVCVNFPFILPEGAKAYKVDATGAREEISADFIPAGTPVLLSWTPTGSSQDLHIVPGYFDETTLASLQEQFSTKLAKLNDEIDEYLETNNEELTKNLIEAYATFGLQGNEDDEESYAQFLGMIKLGVRNYVSNMFYEQHYAEVFGDALAQKETQAQAIKESISRGNSLWWCGDYFGYNKKSSLYGQEPSKKGIYRLSAINSDGEPAFEETVEDADVTDDYTSWNGNIAYLNKGPRTLQWVVNYGVQGSENNHIDYEISDELVAFAYVKPNGTSDYLIFAKDNNNYLNKDICEEGWINYVEKNYSDIIKDQPNKDKLTYEDNQSNWVCIKANKDFIPNNIKQFADDYNYNETAPLTIRNIKGYLSNINNPTIVLTEKLSGGESSDLAQTNNTINTYVTANFYKDIVQTGSNGKKYFFAHPKPNEVMRLTWGLYSKANDAFIMPAQSSDRTINGADLKGGVKQNDFLSEGELVFNDGKGYNLIGIVQKAPVSLKKSPRRAEAVIGDPSQINSDYMLYPLYIEEVSPIVTAITSVNSNKAVATIQYVNLAGQRSNRPWQGINIVVTRYTDGTTATTKVIL